MILLEIVQNLRANFEEKTSRGGRPHDLYWFEILTLKSLCIFLSANEDIYTLNCTIGGISLTVSQTLFNLSPFTNVIFYIRSVLYYSFLTVLSALNLPINATYFNLTNKNVF